MALGVSVHKAGSADPGRRWSNVLLCPIIFFMFGCSSDVLNSSKTLGHGGLHGQSSVAPTLSPVVQKQAKKLLARIESAGTGVNLAEVRERDAEELVGLIDAVDVPALILSARFHRVLLLLEPAVFGNAGAGSSGHFDRSVAAGRSPRGLYWPANAVL
jgi:hypothetical protein